MCDRQVIGPHFVLMDHTFGFFAPLLHFPYISIISWIQWLEQLSSTRCVTMLEKVRGSKTLGCNVGHQKDSKCHTRGHSEDHTGNKACKWGIHPDSIHTGSWRANQSVDTCMEVVCIERWLGGWHLIITLCTCNFTGAWHSTWVPHETDDL